MMKVIGITGGVGSGKSAILQAVSKKFNCRVFLADDIANFLKEPGQRCYQPLVELLGPEVLDGRGYLDKKKMADVIFENTDILEKVNSHRSQQ